MTARIVLVLVRIEARELASLVAQFAELLGERSAAPDADLARLTPTAYPDDEDAAAEFRAATAGDLLDRREREALRMLADLTPAFDGDDPNDPIQVVLSREDGWAWLRTLTALRLVIAGRLGITEDDGSRENDDERFAVYDWLGYRLDTLVHALDGQDREEQD